MTNCTNAATDQKGAHKCMWHTITQLEGSEAHMNTMEPSNVDTIYRCAWNVTVSIFQDSHISNRCGTMHLEWHGTYPDWKIRCIKAWCLLYYYLKSLWWQHCSLPEFRTNRKLTGVFARKPHPTQTLSVGIGTQYIPPWVSKISSDIMAYGEAGNGNGYRNGKENGKVKLKKLLHGTV